MESIKAADDIGPGQRVEDADPALPTPTIKLSPQVRKLLPETSKLAIALQVLEMLAKYIQEHKPELLIDVL